MKKCDCGNKLTIKSTKYRSYYCDKCRDHYYFSRASGKRIKLTDKISQEYVDWRNKRKMIREMNKITESEL